MMMNISAIIPVVAPTPETEATVRSIAAQSQPAGEMLLVSPTDVSALAESFAAEAIHTSEPSLPTLLNAGARAASGDVLFFVCPPAHFPPTATDAIVRNLSLLPTTIGGSFHLHFNAPLGTFAAKMAKMMRYHRHYDWDSGIFVRAETFAALGGIAPSDRTGHQFAQRLENLGATVYPPDEITLPAGHIFKLMWRWLAVYPFATERNIP